MSEVYKISSEFHRNVQHGLMGNSAVFKQLRAIPELKCKISEFYYMEGKAFGAGILAADSLRLIKPLPD